MTRSSQTRTRRGCILVMTREGRRTLERAAPYHVASVRAHLLDLLDDDELATLTRIAERVVDRLAAGAS